MTGERWAAVGLLTVLLVGAGLLVWDQMAYCGVRCTAGIQDSADLDRLAREQGIERLPVPPCAGTGAAVEPLTWPAPGPVTAVVSGPSEELFAAGPAGDVWTAPVPADGGSAQWTPWAPGTSPVSVGSAVTALAVSTDPAHLLVATAGGGAGAAGAGAAGAGARVLVLDVATGAQVADWPLPDDAAVRAIGVLGQRAVLADAASGALYDAVLSRSGAWGPLRQLRPAGALPGATQVVAGVAGGGTSRPVALVTQPEGVRRVDVRTGTIRVLVTNGPGVDVPLTDEAPARLRTAAAAVVGDGVVLVDEGRVRPAALDTQWTALGVGAASAVPGLGAPTAVTGTATHVVVADGGEQLLAVPAPRCG